VLPVLIVHLRRSDPQQSRSVLAQAGAEPLSQAMKVPKNNAEFYLGKGRKVLEMAEIDDDEDDDTTFSGAQISRYKSEES
jgi:hypothetical protein